MNKEPGQEEVQQGYVHVLFRDICVCVYVWCVTSSCHNLQECCIRTWCFLTLQLTGSCYVAVLVKRKTHFSFFFFFLHFLFLFIFFSFFYFFFFLFFFFFSFSFSHFSFLFPPLVFVRTLGSSLVYAWWEPPAKMPQLKWMTFANTEFILQKPMDRERARERETAPTVMGCNWVLSLALTALVRLPVKIALFYALC